ncbi:MAG TPA: hypothetical protein VK622_04330 [Puia sp.]|nr:hypothetical protein [Puia sp.]
MAKAKAEPTASEVHGRRSAHDQYIGQHHNLDRTWTTVLFEIICAVQNPMPLSLVRELPLRIWRGVIPLRSSLSLGPYTFGNSMGRWIWETGSYEIKVPNSVKG